MARTFSVSGAIGEARELRRRGAVVVAAPIELAPEHADVPSARRSRASRPARDRRARRRTRNRSCSSAGSSPRCRQSGRSTGIRRRSATATARTSLSWSARPSTLIPVLASVSASPTDATAAAVVGQNSRTSVPASALPLMTGLALGDGDPGTVWLSCGGDGRVDSMKIESSPAGVATRIRPGAARRGGRPRVGEQRAVDRREVVALGGELVDRVGPRVHDEDVAVGRHREPARVGELARLGAVGTPRGGDRAVADDGDRRMVERVDVAGGPDRHVKRAGHELERVEVGARGVEPLHAAVSGVGDVHVSVRRDRDAVGVVELRRPRARTAPAPQRDGAVGVELLHARAIDHVHVARGRGGGPLRVAEQAAGRAARTPPC